MKRMPLKMISVRTLACLPLVAVLVACAPPAPPPGSAATVATRPTVSPQNFEQISLSFAPITERVSQSVVQIVAEKTLPGIPKPEPVSGAPEPTALEKFVHEMQSRPRTQTVLQSGTVISADGQIVTLRDGIEDDHKLRIILKDGRELTAQQVRYDAWSHLLLLKVDPGAKPLTPFDLSEGEAVRMGDLVLSVAGFPYRSLRASMGLIAGVRRYQGVGPHLIETDLTVQKGSAGGALVSTEGRLLGILLGGRAGPNGQDATSYAIPAEVVRFLLKDGPVENGKVIHAGIGLKLQNIFKEDAAVLGLPDNRGAIISDVRESSAGAAAGLRRGDVIRAFDGSEIENFDDYTDRLQLRRPGETVTLQIVRSRKPMTITVRLSELR